MANLPRIFPVFCTTDASSELLTTFLLHSMEPFRNGQLNEFSRANDSNPISSSHLNIGSVTGSVILRSRDLSTITSQTPLPLGSNLPLPLSPTHFKDWIPQQCLEFLQTSAPGTRVHENWFIVLDERSESDLSCFICENGAVFDEEGVDEAGRVRIREIGRELKTVRTSFRGSTLSLCNLEIGNMDIEEMEDSARDGGGVNLVEDEEARRKDLEGGRGGERVLRDGRVVRRE